MNPRELSRAARLCILGLMLLSWVGILGSGLAGFGAFESPATRWLLRLGWIAGLSVVVWMIGRAGRDAIERLEDAASSGV